MITIKFTSVDVQKFANVDCCSCFISIRWWSFSILLVSFLVDVFGCLMMWFITFSVFLLLVKLAFTFYDFDEYVVELSSDNFNSLVTESDDVWVVQFYVSWCKLPDWLKISENRVTSEFFNLQGTYSRKLAPEYKNAAAAFKGSLMFGAADCDVDRPLCDRFGIKTAPHIRMFTGNMSTEYRGPRNASDIVWAASTLQTTKKRKLQSPKWVKANWKFLVLGFHG